MLEKAEPTSFWQGDTVSWARSDSEYSSADGWALTYLYSRADDARQVVGAGQADGSWIMTIAPTASALYLPGAYRWQARVSKAAEVYTLGQGGLDVIASLDTAIETRSGAKVILDAIDAVLTGKADRDQLKITINGQSLDRFTWSDLTAARSYYASKVAREEQARSNREGTPGPAYIQGLF